jgi:hypothetical protein
MTPEARREASKRTARLLEEVRQLYKCAGQPLPPELAKKTWGGNRVRPMTTLEVPSLLMGEPSVMPRELPKLGLTTMITAKDDFRFTSKTKLNPDNECLEWQAAKTKDGYGLFSVGSKMVLAHRWMWEVINGPLEPGQVVRHFHCGNPKCVRSDHLKAGTQQENMDDRAAGDPTYRKLSDRDVATAVGLLILGWTQTAVAAHFGVSQPLISDLKNGLQRPEAIDRELERDLARSASA